MDVRHVKTAEGKLLEIALKNLQGKVGKVGWFEKAKYEDGTQVAQVAAIQEYGLPAKYIPARPFMRPTIDEKSSEWKNTAERLSRLILKGKETIGGLMEKLGGVADGDIAKKIKSIWSPALAESTILSRVKRHSRLSKLKRRLEVKDIGNINKPLVDTGHMLGTLTHTVEDE